MICLRNPMVQLAFGLLLSALLLSIGGFVVRHLRKALVKGDLTNPAHDGLPLHTYHAVIQELKQQKHELQTAQQAERRRAKASENISGAILSHLSSGVLFFTPNGLVRQANGAAKQILGYASPHGLSAQELFRNARLLSGAKEQPNLASVVGSALQDNIPANSLEAQFVTPSGVPRILELKLTSVRAPAGDLLGVACLITDKTEVATIQKEQELRGELSAEMALSLRNSLAAVTSYARQIATSSDPERAQELASDIISESAQLERTIGGFLAERKAAASAAGG